MNTIHTKSSCCNARVVRHGARRRRCTTCRKSWSVRKAKRGRKRIRTHGHEDALAFPSNETLRHRAQRTGVGRERIRRRHARQLEKFLARTQPPEVPTGPCIALVDAKRFKIGKKWYHLYVVLIRPVASQTAYLMDPVLLPGYETARAWERILAPYAAKTDIVALVGDGLTSMEKLAIRYGWVYQRCHAHLIRSLQALRGSKWRTVTYKEERERMYQTIRTLLTTEDECEVERCVRAIAWDARGDASPTWFGRRARGFLDTLAQFRAYRRHPELLLPTTTNSVECVMNWIDDLYGQTRGFNSPTQLERWAIALLRHKKTVRCRGN